MDVSLEPLAVDPSTIRVTIVANAQSSYWNPVQIGAARAASKRGCVANFVSPPDRNATQQAQVFDDQVASGVMGIAVSAIDPTGMESHLVAAANKGVDVITLDSDANPGSVRSFYVGSDNYEAGTQAGKKLRELLGGAGKVALEFANPAPLSAVERIRGIKDAFPELVVVDNGDGDGILADQGDFTAARTLLDAAISQNPDLAGIIAGYAYHGGIACNAVKAAGKSGQIKIVAFDTNSDTMACLSEGTISAVIGQRPYYQGYLSVEVLYSLSAQGLDATMTLLQPWLAGSDGKTVDTGIDVLTAATLSSYRDFLASLGVSSQ
jgi:ribose transport system substrate-binding protein